MTDLHACRVVLVRPRIAANIGATARAMRNLGLSRLVLVAPEADVADPRGRLLATHAEDILDQTRIVADFGEAVADCVLVAGTSARIGGLFRRQSVGLPETILPHVLKAMRAGPTALVFGPEPSGLTDAEVTRCHYLIHLPTDPAHPALNLAQAVAICLYELRRLWLGHGEPGASAPGETLLTLTLSPGADAPGSPTTLSPGADAPGSPTTLSPGADAPGSPTTLSPGADAPGSPLRTPATDSGSPAPFDLLEHMFMRLREALEAIHFLYGSKADAVMHGLRHLLGRAQPTEMEIMLLLGLVRQLRWVAGRLKKEDS